MCTLYYYLIESFKYKSSILLSVNKHLNSGQWMRMLKTTIQLHFENYNYYIKQNE